MVRGRTSDYAKLPISIVFATSNRSNAKIKIKTIKNKNIDQLIDCNFNIPGIPKIAVILEVGVGRAFHDIYKKKYGI
jgi:hypothetical protein